MIQRVNRNDNKMNTSDRCQKIAIIIVVVVFQLWAWTSICLVSESVGQARLEFALQTRKFSKVWSKTTSASSTVRERRDRLPAVWWLWGYCANKWCPLEWRTRHTPVFFIFQCPDRDPRKWSLLFPSDLSSGWKLVLITLTLRLYYGVLYGHRSKTYPTLETRRC